GIDCLRLDRYVEQTQVFVYFGFYGAAPGAGLDHLVLELLLGRGHLRLKLLNLLHHRAHVEPTGTGTGHHAASSFSPSDCRSSASSSASNSDFRCSSSSSSLRAGSTLAASSCSSPSSSTNTGRRRWPPSAQLAPARQPR